MDLPEHIPVLGREVIELLNCHKGGVFFDGTVGLGGHDAMILDSAPENRLFGTDRDSGALEIARQKLADRDDRTDRFTFFNADFREIRTLPVNITDFDGFLFDLGVSSFQLDSPEKGFSYSQKAPLDMRMDKTQQLTANEVVNRYTYNQLFDIFQRYGELKNPIKIVQQIIVHRKNKKITDTEELKTIIRRVCPQRRTMDPLSRVFQALRIEVNHELNGLEEFFADLVKSMKPGARLAVISFHSLEDRIVKHVLKDAAQKKQVRLLTRKPIMADEDENHANPRARSAKLRAAEKM